MRLVNNRYYVRPLSDFLHTYMRDIGIIWVFPVRWEGAPFLSCCSMCHTVSLGESTDQAKLTPTDHSRLKPSCCVDGAVRLRPSFNCDLVSKTFQGRGRLPVVVFAPSASFTTVTFHNVWWNYNASTYLYRKRPVG